jgi:hypothetical protein
VVEWWDTAMWRCIHIYILRGSVYWLNTSVWL